MNYQLDNKKNRLIDIIQAAHNKDNVGTLKVIDTFDRAIRSFSYKLNYEDAYTDLVIFLLGLCQSVDLHKIENLNEGAIVKYFYNSLRHEFIRLSKRNKKYTSNEQSYGIDPSEIINNDKMNHDIYSDVLFYDMINNLTAKEKQIIKYIFLWNYSDVETSKTLGISKQAVGKIKRKALQKMKLELTNKKVEAASQ